MNGIGEILMAPKMRARLESEVLPQYLPRQRWYGAKSRAIRSCRIDDWVPLTSRSGLAFCTVQSGAAAGEVYVVPLALADGAEAERIGAQTPNAVVCPVALDGGAGVVYDALASDETCLGLYELLARSAERRGTQGVLRGAAGRELEATRAPKSGWPVARLGSEQSNTSIIFGDRFILKLFRRVAHGPQPDCEITRFLTERAAFDGVPAFAGSAEYFGPGGTPASVAMLQRLVPNRGDGWRWMLEELARYQERALAAPAPEPAVPSGPRAWIEAGAAEPPPGLRRPLDTSRDAAAALGRRTAEMHLALARATDDPAFRPEPLTAASLAQLAADIRGSATASFQLLAEVVPRLPDDVAETARRALSLQERLGMRLDRLPDLRAECLRIRIHGDYHLGQVLRTDRDFVIIDFEGEPARPLDERRAKLSPLRDVAGMLRSFSYAAQAALVSGIAARPNDAERLGSLARHWERSVCSLFLQVYLDAVTGSGLIPADRGALETLLEAFLLDKVLYELRYELDNRPSWVRLPLLGLLDLEPER
jgi:maltose alpha-D-glucosyltransferase/alpha-amylase